MHIFSSLSIRRAGLSAVALAGALSALAGCTDLTETPLDALTPANAFKNDAEILAGAASVYAQLRETDWSYYNLAEITTDEQVVPTRGSDWFDNGRWIEIYKQTWTANSGSALDDMNGLWNGMFAGVAKANLMIDVVEKSSSATKNANLAELKVLRAWFYYILMDYFGGVPIVTTTEVKPAARNTRDEVFKFIETEIKASLPNLPDRPAAFGRVNKHVANAILANMYLNAPVFQGTVTAAGLQRAPERLPEAITYADAVINSGVYGLASNWQSNFNADNASSPELIFFVNNTSNPPGLGTSLPQRPLHYAQFGVGGGPWNGFATIAETYRKYDPADQRRNIWLVGQQKSFVTGQNVNDRSGNPLVFTETINDITNATEAEGPRINKFPPFISAPDGDSHPHKFPFFRLTEMYVIKAEALIKQGNVAGGIDIINDLRIKHNVTTKQLSRTLSQTEALAALKDERLFEFAGEAKRRQDLIRLGGYLDARQFKAASAGYRVLMPIPIVQIQNNPLLTQNAGY